MVLGPDRSPQSWKGVGETIPVVLGGGGAEPFRSLRGRAGGVSGRVGLSNFLTCGGVGGMNHSLLCYRGL